MDAVNPWEDAVAPATTQASVTYDQIVAAMRKIEDTKPIAVVHGPESASVIEHLMGDRLRVVVNEHIERGAVYVFNPSALDNMDWDDEDWRQGFAKIINVGEA